MDTPDRSLERRVWKALRANLTEAEARTLFATLEWESLARRTLFLLRSGLIQPSSSGVLRVRVCHRFRQPRMEQRLVSLFAD